MAVKSGVLLRVVLVAGLAWYYVTGALDHARTVNTFKARGDQSAYLFEGQILYRNWHGLNDPPVVQPRNRMPLYAAFLATFYNPHWSDDEFFGVAKRASIYLSMALLAVTGVVLWRHLPPLPAANLLMVIAFGYFIFKAGYTQSELLFYSLHFLTFVACWHLFVERRQLPLFGYACAAGVLAALTYLTKAATLPFVAIVVVTYLGRTIVTFLQTRTFHTVAREITAALILAASFLGGLFPYITTSKRIHGQYFYNLNTAAVIWYDNYPDASVALLSYGPDGWPPGPRSARPGLQKYWREHTAAQIADRLEHGFRDMAVQFVRGYWVLKFLGLYVAAALVVAVTRPRDYTRLVRDHGALTILLVAYAAVYLPAIAFYEAASGTGTARFLLAHVAPFLFAISMLLSSQRIVSQSWVIGGVPIRIQHFHLLVAATMAVDIMFVLRTRLMTTYGGF